MSLLSETIIAVLIPFAGPLSATVWTHAQVLMIGAILCQDPCTVAAALVRRTLWAHQYFGTSVNSNEGLLFPTAIWAAVLDQLATTA